MCSLYYTCVDVTDGQSSMEGDDSTHKAEGRAHVQKLFSQMKTGGVVRKKLGSLPAFELTSNPPIQGTPCCYSNGCHGYIYRSVISSYDSVKRVKTSTVFNGV